MTDDIWSTDDSATHNAECALLKCYIDQHSCVWRNVRAQRKANKKPNHKPKNRRETSRPNI